MDNINSKIYKFSSTSFILIFIMFIFYNSTLKNSNCSTDLKNIELSEDVIIEEYNLNLFPEFSNFSCIGKVILVNSIDDEKIYKIGSNDFIYFLIMILNPLFFVLLLKLKILENKLAVILNYLIILLFEYIFNYRIAYSFFNYYVFIYPFLIHLIYIQYFKK